MRIRLILIAVILGIAGNLTAADLPVLAIRESATVWWNHGWGDKFFFHTLTLDDLQSGNPLDFNRTLRHTTWLNFELWYTPAKSDDLSLSLVGKYRHLGFSLRDTIDFSFESARKRLKTNLHFFSIGVRLSHPVWYFRAYGGLDIGYCRGDLLTDQYLKSPGVFTYHIESSGTGGGLFNEFVVGASTSPIWSGFIKPGFFLEVGLRITPEWESFDVDEVMVKEDQGDVSEGIKDLLKYKDRQISKLEGFFVSFGLEILIW
jgi:hypothetical protein